MISRVPMDFDVPVGFALSDVLLHRRFFLSFGNITVSVYGAVMVIRDGFTLSSIVIRRALIRFIFWASSCVGVPMIAKCLEFKNNPPTPMQNPTVFSLREWT